MDLLKYLKLKPLFLDMGCRMDEHGNIKELKRFEYLVKQKGWSVEDALVEVLKDKE